ncbi:IQ-DOMAIN 14-like protein [Tanacetum coccineum]
MGKVTRWFRGVLGMKKDKVNIDNSNAKKKKRWSFGKCMKHLSQRVTVENDSTRMRSCMSASEKEQNKHAIAVAATTAAVAGAQAAVAVVRLTSDGMDTLFSGREKWAATKIQSVYRGHLARRALRALRGLVKFQALVKGFVVRKRVAATLYSMQALLRAQLAVRSQRAHRSFKDHRVQPEIRHQKSTEGFDNDTRSEIHSKRLSTSYDSKKNSYDESPKIAEMEPYRPHGQSRRNHYQDPERGFTGKDYKCSKTTRSTPRVAYSNRSNTPTRPPKSGLMKANKKEDMGKVSKWFRGLLGMKKDKENMDNSNAKTKRRWCFGKSMKNPSQRVTVENDSTRMRSCMSASEKEQNNHAIAVAETAVAAADAAVAGAQAAVAVVRLTSDGRGTLFSGREKWAATKIQSARRALRALRGLVKFQALVKGFVVRKRVAATLYSMQALLRAQLAVGSQRAHRSFIGFNLKSVTKNPLRVDVISSFPIAGRKSSLANGIEHTSLHCSYVKCFFLASGLHINILKSNSWDWNLYEVVLCWQLTLLGVYLFHQFSYSGVKVWDGLPSRRKAGDEILV